jgi:hypothetical protein
MESAAVAFEPSQRDVEALIGEIGRYLDVLDAFRAAGCEPRFEDDEPVTRLLAGCYPGV